MEVIQTRRASPRADVAVVVPCYNYGHFLTGCVHSILECTSLDVTVIVVDDCSTDDTPQVCAQLSRETDKVRVVRHERNRGHIATFNHGRSLANSDFVHLISADDELTPFSLDRAVAIMRRHPDVGMVYGRALTGSVPIRPPYRESEPTSYSIVRGADWIEARCEDGRNPIYSPEVTLRGAVARAAGDYDERLPRNADLEMWLRIAARSNVAILENVNQAFYRSHPNSMHIAHGKEGLLRCIEECASSYRFFFAKDGHLLADPDRLHATARERMARDALRQARLVYDEGHSDEELLGQAMEFARSMTDAAEELGEWAMVQRRRNRSHRHALKPWMLGRLSARISRWWAWQIRNRNLGHKGLPVIHTGNLK